MSAMSQQYHSKSQLNKTSVFPHVSSSHLFWGAWKEEFQISRPSLQIFLTIVNILGVKNLEVSVLSVNTGNSHLTVSYNLAENTCNPSPVAITEKRGACFPSSFSGWLLCVMGSIPQGKGICQRSFCRKDPTWFFSTHTHKGSNGHVAYPLIFIHSAQGRCLRGGKEIRKECWTNHPLPSNMN